MRPSKPSFRKRVRPACGTWLEISGALSDAAFEAGFAEAARLERLFGPGARPSAPSPELAEVLALGARIEAESGGAFRLRGADGRYDLGGIAKGYIVDRVFEALPAEGALLVNAGGDLRARGRHEIEVRVPVDDGPEHRYAAVLEDAALATSSRLGARTTVGDASARFGPSASAAATATVLADTAAHADALTKVALFGDVGEASGAHAVLRFDARGARL